MTAHALTLGANDVVHNVGDIDGDGLDELVVQRSNGLSVVDVEIGTITPVSDVSGEIRPLGDYNLDGLADFAVRLPASGTGVSTQDRVVLFLGDVDEKIKQSITINGASDIANVGDWDNDGYVDLGVLAAVTSGDVRAVVLFGGPTGIVAQHQLGSITTNGVFSRARTAFFPDKNGDGKREFVASTVAGNTSIVVFWPSQANTRTPSSTSKRMPAPAGFLGFGYDMQAVLHPDTGQPRLLVGAPGDGRLGLVDYDLLAIDWDLAFQGIPTAGHRVESSDVNADGIMDFVAYSHDSRRVGVYYGADGTTEERSGGMPVGGKFFEECDGAAWPQDNGEVVLESACGVEPSPSPSPGNPTTPDPSTPDPKESGYACNGSQGISLTLPLLLLLLGIMSRAGSRSGPPHSRVCD